MFENETIPAFLEKYGEVLGRGIGKTKWVSGVVTVSARCRERDAAPVRVLEGVATGLLRPVEVVRRPLLWTPVLCLEPVPHLLQSFRVLQLGYRKMPRPCARR